MKTVNIQFPVKVALAKRISFPSAQRKRRGTHLDPAEDGVLFSS